MAKRSSSTKRERSKAGAGRSARKTAKKPQTSATPQQESADGLTEKQQMVEKFFRHTNDFLEANKHDPLLVVEALAAIVVRYAALLGPVEQLKDRLNVLERLIGQECAQIQEIAKSAAAADQTNEDQKS